MTTDCPRCGSRLYILEKRPSAGWMKGKRRNFELVMYACDVCGLRMMNH